MKPNMREYGRARALGNTARDSLHHARLAAAWSKRDGDNGDVRVRFEPDQDCFADVRDAEYERANRDGVWIAITEYVDAETGEWMEADSCGGFIGDDWKDSGYDDDMKRAALRARLESLKRWRDMCRSAP